MSSQLGKIYQSIDRAQKLHLDRIREFLRIPSVSEEDRGMEECASFLRRWFKELGSDKAEIIKTKRHPVVYAEFDEEAATTLIVYFMYDVKQVSGEEWKLAKDPFQPTLTAMPPFRKVLVGRGAANQKGPCGAFLNAVESILKTRGKLPVNLLFVSDGEEEIGSPNLRTFVTSYRKRLNDADGVIFPSATQDIRGVSQISLGCKGSAPFELECSGSHWGRGPSKFDIHSSYAALVDSPAWRLIHALSTMTDPEGPYRVAIAGFYDSVVPPSAEELRLAEMMVPRFDEEALTEVLGVERFIDDLHGREAVMKLLFSPTLNIQGIYGGYTGKGFKTVTPYRVRVKLECRLVPDQSYTEILERVREHLESHGYGDIKIVAVRNGGRSHEWSRTSVKAPLVRAVISAHKKHGFDPVIWPTSPGSAPWHVFTKNPLRVPVIQAGICHGGRQHAPDEYLVISGNDRVKGLAEFEKSFVTVLYEAADRLEKKC